MSTTQSTKFFHESATGCSCPIHQNEPGDRDPTTVPLGHRFAGDVEVRPIPRSTAAEIYDAHHTYRKDMPSTNVAHHGIYFQGSIMGALTYRYGLGGRRKLRWDEDGNLLARRKTDSDFDSLPEEFRLRARSLIPSVTDNDIATERVISGDKFLEAARICLGADFPNLASAGLARSQDRIIEDFCREHDVEYLYTFVRADYPASMILALRDRGWQCTGWGGPTEAGNRDHDEIRDEYKWRFVAPIETLSEQANLTDWDRTDGT